MRTVNGAEFRAVWNQILDKVRKQVVDLALEEPELSPRELAVRFTDSRRYFVSEASVYRVLRAHDLITSPAFVAIKPAEEFHETTTRPNQLWQTDFTCLSGRQGRWTYSPNTVDHRAGGFGEFEDARGRQSLGYPEG